MSNRILYIVIAVAVGIGIVATVINQQQAVPVATVCTADAMICPDGSSVGRTGPNCEFVCP